MSGHTLPGLVTISAEDQFRVGLICVTLPSQDDTINFGGVLYFQLPRLLASGLVWIATAVLVTFF